MRTFYLVYLILRAPVTYSVSLFSHCATQRAEANVCVQVSLVRLMPIVQVPTDEAFPSATAIPC